LPGHHLQHIVTQQVLSAFPSTVCIIICHNQKVSFSSPAFAAVPFRGLQQLQQRPGITTPRAGVTSRWSERAFVMLMADSQPQEAASSRQQPGKWSLLLKPLPSGDLPRHNDGHDVWCFSHTGSIMTSLLLHEDAKLSSKEVSLYECGLRLGTCEQQLPCLLVLDFSSTVRLGMLALCQLQTQKSCQCVCAQGCACICKNLAASFTTCACMPQA
jgi:hypothetical protein